MKNNLLYKNKIKTQLITSLQNKNDLYVKKILEYNKSRIFGANSCICFAAKRSILWGENGITVPCCLNREKIYGTYPKNTVDEILNSETRKILQQHLEKSDLSFGCNVCEDIIKSGNFQSVNARLADTLPDVSAPKFHKEDFKIPFSRAEANYPSEMIFELDNNCNLNCIMCKPDFSKTVAKHRNCNDAACHVSPYDQNFVKQLEKYIPYLKNTKFLGGEPFLINIYYDIWDLIIKLNPKCNIHVQTNATIFNEKIKNYLKNYKFHIGISIDSLQKDNFEAIRRNANYDSVMKNTNEIMKILKSKGRFLNLSVCPMQQNWQDIPEIVNFCNKNNIFLFFNTVYTKGFSLSELSIDELKNILSVYNNVKVKKFSLIYKKNKQTFNDLKNYIKEIIEEKENYQNKINNRKILKYKFSTSQFAKICIERSNNNEQFISKIKETYSKLGEHEFYINEEALEDINLTNYADLELFFSYFSEEDIIIHIKNFIKNGYFDNIDYDKIKKNEKGTSIN